MAKNELSQKVVLCQFLDFTIVYYHAKKQQHQQKKTEKTNQKKVLTEKQTDRQW